ncbi:hypothetical protein KY339_01950 [Candidatus Woesearchaeota archaeon]|nr:hypothetical protein [Candidatus Woesearchaeota archaeon]
MVSIKEKLEQGYLHCNIILEVLGKPKDYVESTLKGYVEKIEKSKDFEVLKKEFAKSKKVEDMFSVFVELDMLFKDASALAFFCFDYMPSSIEIIEPEIFKYKAQDFSGFFNDLQARLHKLDMLVKNLTAENKRLKTNAGLLLRNNILIVLKETDKSIAELSKGTGIPEKQLEPFVEKLVKQKFIIKNKNKYSINKQNVKFKKAD